MYRRNPVMGPVYRCKWCKRKFKSKLNRDNHEKVCSDTKSPFQP